MRLNDYIGCDDKKNIGIVIGALCIISIHNKCLYFYFYYYYFVIEIFSLT